MPDAATLRSLAENFRKLAENADDMTAGNLRTIADEYEDQARQLDDQPPPTNPK